MFSFEKLPDLVKIEVAKKLGVHQLNFLAHVSRSLHQLSEENSVWKTRLIEDYGIPVQSAELLQKTLGYAYKQVYRYWSQYIPNQRSGLYFTKPEQDRAKKKLYGIIDLTDNHFYQRSWFNNFYHTEALYYLITQRQLSFVEAMIELDRTTATQARVISLGYTREEILSLNCHQLTTLRQIKTSPWCNQGLTGFDLCKLTWFNSEEHSFFFSILISKNGANLSPHQALQTLDGLNLEQVKLMRQHSLSRTAVTGLNHLECLTVKTLCKSGFTVEAVSAISDSLRQSIWRDSKYHHALFIKRAVDQQLNVQEAITELNQLTPLQAENICKDRPKDAPPEYYVYQCGPAIRIK